MSQDPMVVVGASIGGVEALKVLVSKLPATLSVPVLIVLHIPPNIPDKLGAVLERNASLPVTYPDDGDPIVSGRIFLASPDKHLVVEKDRIRLGRGGKECHVRPAIDVLFRSAAASFGPKALGILLSGNLYDGTAGLHAIKQCGGVALVQSPDEAQWPSMPLNAIRHGLADRVLPVADMPDAVVQFVQKLACLNQERRPNSGAIGFPKTNDHQSEKTFVFPDQRFCFPKNS